MSKLDCRTDVYLALAWIFTHPWCFTAASFHICLSCLTSGGEGPAVEASNGLPERCDWTQLYDTDSHNAVRRQQQGGQGEMKRIPPPPNCSFLCRIAVSFTQPPFMYLCLCAEQDPSSEERFHVELHFSPGVKGCEDEETIPLGFGFRPASSEVCDHTALILLVENCLKMWKISVSNQTRGHLRFKK